MHHNAPPKRKITMDDVVHTGPGTLAGRYLRQFWQPVFRSEDLAPARPKPVKLMSEDFTLYRGESGEAHAVAFRCAHRGTQLSTGWVEGDNLRCFYHGWVYDGSGQCVEQPAEPKPFCQKVRIRGYPVQEYLGLIFVYMGDAERGDTGAFRPPPFPRFVELEDFQDGVRFASSIPIQPCNFFNRIDQALDHCHTIFAHRESFVEEGGLEGIPTLSAEETEYGAHLRIVHPNGVEGAGHFQMPNINTFEAAPRWPETGWTTNVFWRVPIDDEHYGQFGITLVPVTGGEEVKQRVLERVRQRRVAPGTDLSPEQLGEEILAGRAHWLDFPHRGGFVQVQDYVILRGQGTYAPRHMEHLGREDVGTILVRKLWERELRALAEGRPLKQWTRPRLSTQYVGLEQ